MNLFDEMDREGARIREAVRAQREKSAALDEACAAFDRVSEAEKNAARVVQTVDALDGEQRARVEKGLPALRTDSIGTCSKCGYHGPGPAHACSDPAIAALSRMPVLSREQIEKAMHIVGPGYPTPTLAYPDVVMK